LPGANSEPDENMVLAGLVVSEDTETGWVGTLSAGQVCEIPANWRSRPHRLAAARATMRSGRMRRRDLRQK